MNSMKQPDQKEYMLKVGNQYFLEKLDYTSNDSQTTYFFPENKTTYQSLQPIEHYPRQKLPIFVLSCPPITIILFPTVIEEGLTTDWGSSDPKTALVWP